MPDANAFHVALTADFFNDSGKPAYDDLGLSVFDDHPHITHDRFKKHHDPIKAKQIGDANGVIVLTPAVTKDTLSSADKLIAIGRFGVGYDKVDVEACTEADVVAFITAGAVDRPVAEATVTWLLTLTHNVLAKDRLVREGKWDDRSNYMGSEMRDRTLGIIGLGGIGKSLVALLDDFGMHRPMAYDPFLTQEMADQAGVRKVELEELLENADFVSIHCPLTDRTRNLIGKRELGLMKKSAYLINTARGGIVDEDALYEALKKNKIAGAGIDCFIDEPITKPHRFADLKNVVLAPHCIAWTNELFRDIGRAACQGMANLSLGKKPRGVLNPAVFEKKSFIKKWSHWTD